jgi:hypothetical protein
MEIHQERYHDENAETQRMQYQHKKEKRAKATDASHPSHFGISPQALEGH